MLKIKPTLKLSMVLISTWVLSGCVVIEQAALRPVLVGMGVSKERYDISIEPYPIVYEENKTWMKLRLRCPSAHNFIITEADAGHEAIICPFHKETINIDEASDRYYYYYYARAKGKPIPVEFLTEQDKKSHSQRIKYLKYE